MKRFVLCAAFVCCPSVVWAQTAVPIIDLEASCLDYARSVNGGEEVRLACVKAQREAYEDMLPMWHDAPDAIRRLCSGQDPKTYAALGYCVISEETKAGINPLPHLGEDQGR